MRFNDSYQTIDISRLNDLLVFDRDEVLWDGIFAFFLQMELD